MGTGLMPDVLFKFVLMGYRVFVRRIIDFGSFRLGGLRTHSLTDKFVPHGFILLGHVLYSVYEIRDYTPFGSVRLRVRGDP